MKGNITFAQFTAVMSTIIVPLMLWGVSLETRLTMHDNKLETNEKGIYKIEGKLDDLQNTSTKILIELQRKQDLDIYNR